MLFQGLCVDVGDSELSYLPSFYLLTRFLNVLSALVINVRWSMSNVQLPWIHARRSLSAPTRVAPTNPNVFRSLLYETSLSLRTFFYLIPYGPQFDESRAFDTIHPASRKRVFTVVTV
jgi:hypothetical protein